jgi:hypothetical protein
VFGTTARLERERNYKVIDLDRLLRRKENSASWIFPKFADDVFRKRLKVAGYDVTQKQSCVQTVYGRGSTPEERGISYAGKAPQRAVRFDSDWPQPWKDFLLELARRNPLSARLAEAWARQKRNRSVVYNIPEPPYPWDGTSLHVLTLISTVDRFGKSGIAERPRHRCPLVAASRTGRMVCANEAPGVSSPT